MSLKLINKEISAEWIEANAGPEAVELLGLNVKSLAEKSEDMEYKETDETVEDEVTDSKVEDVEQSDTGEEVESEESTETTDTVETEKDYGDLPQAISLITSAISALNTQVKELNKKIADMETKEVGNDFLIPDVSWAALVNKQLQDDGFDEEAIVKEGDERLEQSPVIDEIQNETSDHPLVGLIEGV